MLQNPFIQLMGARTSQIWGKNYDTYVKFQDSYYFSSITENSRIYRFTMLIFIRPSSDGTYYGMVMSVRPSVRLSICPSVRLSIRPSVQLSVRVSIRPFSALFSYMLWHIELKFCTWLCFNVLQVKFECCRIASIFEGVMPLCELRI